VPPLRRTTGSIEGLGADAEAGGNLGLFAYGVAIDVAEGFPTNPEFCR
jgi:hypothetical protein